MTYRTPRITRFALPLAAIGATVALAACGGGSSSNSGGGSGSAGSAAAVSVKNVDGVGSVLVDQSGMPVYTPQQEADGKVRCSGACTSIWIPVKVDGKPTGSGNTGNLGVLTRSDGTRQLTVGGKPVYTFAQDSPGKATGNGVTDAFGGQSFTWHAVKAGGGSASGSSSGSKPQPYSY